MRRPTPTDALLALAVAALRPETRRDVPTAYAFAWRVQRLGEPFPRGFVEIGAVEAAAHYVDQLRPRGHVVSSGDGIAMTPERAAALYRARLSSEALAR